MGYTQNDVERIFKTQGLILKDKYINFNTPLFCIDEYGYKYLKRLGDVIKGKGNFPIHSRNPYNIDNIDLYIKLNNINAKRLSNSYVDSKTNMMWECACGKIFYTSWNQFQGGKHSCNFCSKSHRFDGYRDYYKEILEECNKRNYELITKDINRSTDYFEYICRKHRQQGIQKSTYDIMINCRKGCRYCGIESRSEKHRISEEELRGLAESKGYIYAGYDYDNDSTKSHKVNIHIICPKHIDKGIQRVKYDNLKRNSGNCKYCVGRERTKEDLQKELDCMGSAITILEYIDYSSPILVQCNYCGHIWETKGVNLTQGHRCPNCVKSIFELSIAKILDDNNYKYIPQYKFNDCRDKNPLPFDFYLPNYNVLIEADGEQHYYPISFGGITDEEAEENFKIVKYHDALKTKYCEDHNITLIRIPYWEKPNLKEVLLENLFSVIYK